MYRIILKENLRFQVNVFTNLSGTCPHLLSLFIIQHHANFTLKEKHFYSNMLLFNDKGAPYNCSGINVVPKG